MSWCPPQESTIKLNCDTNWIESLNKATIAVIAQKHRDYIIDGLAKLVQAAGEAADNILVPFPLK